MKFICPYCSAHLDFPSELFRFCPVCGGEISWEPMTEPGNISDPASPESSPSAAAPEPLCTSGVLRNEQPVCPVCCTPITQDDSVIQCPDCKMLYHKECWEDNFGCATYGCPSGGCLSPPPEVIQIPPVSASRSAGDTAPVFRNAVFPCPSCGIELRSGDTFCWSCGAEIGNRQAGFSFLPKVHPQAPDEEMAFISRQEAPTVCEDRNFSHFLRDKKKNTAPHPRLSLPRPLSLTAAVFTV